jgi:Zn-finger protein
MNKPKGYADSIMQTEKECFFTGRIECLDPHEIYYGSNRQVSIKNGFWIWVCRERHTYIHNNDGMNQYLKKICQEKYEENNSRESFLKIIGRNYL